MLKDMLQHDGTRYQQTFLSRDMYLLANLALSDAIDDDQAKKLAEQPQVIASVRMALDILSRLITQYLNSPSHSFTSHANFFLNVDMLDEIPNLQLPSTRLPNKHEAHPPRAPLASPRTNNNHRSARVPPVLLQTAAMIDASSPPDLSARSHASSLSSSSRTRATSNSPIPENNLPATPRSSLFPPQQPSPGHRQREKASVPVNSEHGEDNIESQLPTVQQSDPATPDYRSSYNHTLPILQSIFGSTLGLGNVITVIKTGNCLIRDDATTFLRDHLPRWKGMWYASSLLMPSRDESAVDHFVKISRCISILNERSNLDRVHILLHRVLRYQFYLHTIRDIKQTPIGQTVKKRGVKNAKYAIDYLLKQLYIDDWDLVGDSEKVRRRTRLHKQNHAGKRLLALSNLIGFGVLLLASAEAINTMKVFPIQIGSIG
ncbi:hypothetical protein BGZ60DRAFT_534399 [Tricladium varicosporioides]|nr:hypothetical protein BGZ60DRAFT_534399 [Hymenoscyphus varicosporioides]